MFPDFLISRVNLATLISTTENRNRLEIELLKLEDSLGEDIPFLDEGFKLAVEDYRKKLTTGLPQKKT